MKPRRPPHHDKPHAELRDASRGERLHKALAELGVGSRRACEEMIAQGRVRVNGKTVVQMPVWVNPAEDRIEVDGRLVSRRVKAGHTYLLVHKPRGYLCTNADEMGRKTVFELVPHEQRLFSVGRLDAEATGLVLLTDDGDLANHLTHPRYEVSKTYEITLAGELEAKTMDRLGKLLGKESRIKVMESTEERTRLLLTLREARGGIRELVEKLGLNVRRLKRLSIGPLELSGVSIGGWRDLTRQEVGMLRKTTKQAEK